jgi:hypothetical protein
MTTLTYRDATGVRHEIVVRKTPTGEWEVLDTSARETLVIESLEGSVDGEPQAEAVARDYVTTGRFTPPTGRKGGQAIPEEGGADAHSDRRPRSAARQSRTRGATLPHPTR